MNDYLESQSLNNVLTLLALFTPILLGGFATIIYWFRAKVSRESERLIGENFRAVVKQISSGTAEERTSAAILLRRFFDPKSEFGVNKTPYSGDCVTVICGLLKVLPTSNLQKALADGLRYAPPEKLVRADLQRANLSKAYLSRNEAGKPLELVSADFFQANLSGASFKGAILKNAQFYEANLARTVLRDADLRGASFHGSTLQGVDLRGADLSECKFDKVRLIGVRFEGAKLPKEAFQGAIGYGNIFDDDAVVHIPSMAHSQELSRQIFISKPGILDIRQHHLVGSIKQLVERRGYEVVELCRSEYDASDVLTKLKEKMTPCVAMIVFGFRSLHVISGEHRIGTDDHSLMSSSYLSTPWNQIEAGMAAVQGKPLLLIHDDNVSDGIFDPMVQDGLINRIKFVDSLKDNPPNVDTWLDSLEQMAADACTSTDCGDGSDGSARLS